MTDEPEIWHQLMALVSCTRVAIPQNKNKVKKVTIQRKTC